MLVARGWSPAPPDFPILNTIYVHTFFNMIFFKFFFLSVHINSFASFAGSAKHWPRTTVVCQPHTPPVKKVPPLQSLVKLKCESHAVQEPGGDNHVSVL